MKLKLTTAGESHGPGLTAIIEGLPRGLVIDQDFINAALKRRQGGVGRGGRQNIETDTVVITAGVRNGMSLGDPLCLTVVNKDCRIDKLKKLSVPRPGHADYPGMKRFRTNDLNNIAERSSARETACQVAAGAVAQLLLKELGVDVLSYVLSIGGVSGKEIEGTLSDARQVIVDNPVYCPDIEASKVMVERINDAKKVDDTLGGVVAVAVDGVPAGLGCVMTKATKLDTLIASALMGIQAVKGVEIGDGFDMAHKTGKEVMDCIAIENGKVFHRSNHSGGIEGGMSNGERMRFRVAKKPISTQKNPLDSVDMLSRKAIKTAYYRSDVTAVPALSVITEMVTAFTIAEVIMETLGSPHIEDVKTNFNNWSQREAID